MGGEIRPYRVLVVCTGNTCRTPMAEALLRAMARDRELKIDVASAGTHAWGGAPANPLAIEVAASEGLDLSGHRAQPLTPELVRWADITLGMSMNHVYRALEFDESSEVRVITEFDPEGSRRDGVPDPIGSGPEAYATAFREMKRCLEEFLRRRFEKVSSD